MAGITCLIETVVEAEASSEEEDNGEEAVVIAVIIMEIEITIAIIMVRVTKTSKERDITMKSQNKFQTVETPLCPVGLIIIIQITRPEGLRQANTPRMGIALIWYHTKAAVHGALEVIAVGTAASLDMRRSL